MRLFRKETWTSTFLILFAVLCVIAFHVTSDNMYNPAYEVKNQEIQPDKVEKIDKGTEVYYLSFSDLDVNHNTLLFYTNHQEVFVHINDELVYSLECADSMFGHTPGAMWNMITLPLDATEVEVTVSQVYPELSKQVPQFELGNTNNIYRDVVGGAAVEIIMSGAIVVIGIALSMYWLIVFWKTNQQRAVLYLGLFAIIFGIWNVGETRFAVFLFENRAFFSYLAFTCLMTMCLPAIFFFKEFLEVEDKIVYKLISGYIVVETVVCQVLHLTGIAGVKQTANYTMVSIVLILVYLLYAIIKGIIDRKNIKKVTINVIGLLILVITTVIDMSSYYINVMKAEKIAKVGFLIYAIILGLETTRVAREKLQEEQKMELLKEMAVKDMLTGCFNRNAYSEDISELTSLEGVQLITFDLNDLKKCNDTKGHKAGDKYISDAAKMITKVFAGIGKVYRMGGDEFCIITKGVSETQFSKKRDALQVAIRHYLVDNPDSGFGIACGYAGYDAELDETIEDIRHRADLSMYRNKKEIKESN